MTDPVADTVDIGIRVAIQTAEAMVREIEQDDPTMSGVEALQTLVGRLLSAMQRPVPDAPRRRGFYRPMMK
jgi:hypothetical protein